MAKYTNNRQPFRPAGAHSRVFEVEPYWRIPYKTLADVEADLRLKHALRRAVMDLEAPQYLIDSIREKIRS